MVHAAYLTVVWCHFPQLEKAATAGVVLVLCLIVLLATEAVGRHFPAVQTGELPLWSLKVDGHLPEAFAVVGYAFYMQVGCSIMAINPSDALNKACRKLLLLNFRACSKAPTSIGGAMCNCALRHWWPLHVQQMLH
eukprot:GHUV01042903.1.p1 GENE.GHUV01042903.1~~GHUV01042903.1.p1  ORF type:complete len:136 (-),score=23.39 GHUV01042903.1:41-448(-)